MDDIFVQVVLVQDVVEQSEIVIVFIVDMIQWVSQIFMKICEVVEDQIVVIGEISGSVEMVMYSVECVMQNVGILSEVMDVSWLVIDGLYGVVMDFGELLKLF